MTDKNASQNFSENHDPQEKGVSGDDITPSQEQRIFLNRPPKSLVDWLVRVHLRLMALEIVHELQSLDINFEALQQPFDLRTPEGKLLFT